MALGHELDDQLQLVSSRLITANRLGIALLQSGHIDLPEIGKSVTDAMS